MTWKKMLLSDLFRIGSSKRVLQSQWKSEGIPFYRGREITRLSATGFVDNELFISEEHYNEVATKYGVPSEGDIVITAIGTIGNSHIVRARDKFYFKDASVLWLKKVADVSTEFINLWLKSPIFFNQLDKGNGATVDTLTIQKLQNVRIAIPTLAEQQRIVTILDEAFAGIATASANAEKNLANARELFNSYLQSVFENKGEDWEEKTFGEVLLKTETVDPTKTPNEEFVYLDVSSVNKETKEIENASLLFGKDAPSRARKLIRTNDVIFATVRPTHSRVAKISEEYDEQVCSTGYFVLRAKEFLNNNLVFYFILTYGFNKQMEKLQKGASYPAVTDSEVKGIYIPFPKSLKTQQKIVQKLDELSTETKKLETIYQQKLVALDELKKSILNQAFSGQLH